MEDNSRNSALVRQRLVSVILGVVAIVAVVIAVSEHRSSSASEVCLRSDGSDGRDLPG